MRITDVFRVALSTFMNNRMRTLLTITGVSIGISAIIYLVSLGYGLQQITIGEIQSIKALTTYNVTTGNSGILALDQEAVNDLKKISNVASVNSLISMSGQISMETQKTDVLINDASSEYLELESPKMTAGQMYTSDNEDNIVVTEVVANAFNIKPADLVGKKVNVMHYVPNPENEKQPTPQNKDYTVCGVIKDSSASYLYIPSGSVTMPEKVNFNAVKVKVNEAKNMSGVKEELVKKGYKTSSIGERIAEMNRIFNIAQIILLIFGTIALIVASIGMFNTLTISLLERTKDIGIMKALGAKDRSIYAIFLAESTIISFAGGLVGVIIAMILGLATNIFISSMAIKAGGEKMVVFQPPILFVLIIFIFSIVVGIITGLYPSRRAARIDPLDALRYE